MLLLVVIGFCIYGPQVLLVGTAPADLAHKGTSAAAAGFVNFMGYMGAATGDVVTGYYSTADHGGWQLAIYIWAGWAFAGAVITAILWNTTARRIGVLPALVPKLGAMAMLVAAGAAATTDSQPAALQTAAYLAAGALVGSFWTRWSALPGIVVALGALVMVFASTIDNDTTTWPQTIAMVACGLAAILSLMVLVEKKDEQSP
jgi:sugar phosphate permease